MTKLSDIIKHAEFAARKKAVRVYTWTQKDGSHCIDVVFKDGTRKEMHAPSGRLEMDWELRQDFLQYQNRIASSL